MNEIQIKAHASRASVDRFLRHTAGIVNGVRITGALSDSGKRADEEQPGTGCFVRWGRHHMILTARHVIEDAPGAELRIFSYPAAGFKVQPSLEVTKKDIVEAIHLNSESSIHVCVWEDLAIVTVNPNDFPGAEFIDIGKDWADPVEGERVGCCGFPSDYHVTVAKTVIAERELIDIGLLPIAFSESVLPVPDEQALKFKFREFDPGRHYLVPYPSSAVTQHPRGISGAAMWWESDERLIVWRPNFKFAGTCISYYPKSEVLEVVKASVVRRFLGEVLGPFD